MIDETLFEAEEKMEKTVEAAKEAFAGIRTGRAHPGMFQKVLVDYYGAPTPLQQLASFQNPEARPIIIRCVMPVLTEERRREYVKMAHSQAEDAKVSVRNVRRSAKTTLEKLVKDGEVGEDEGARAEKELEAVTKRHVDQIDELLKHKEAELLEV